jgi:hypothetical protein
MSGRHVERGGAIEDWRETWVIQRNAAAVGIDLHAAEAELADGAIELGDRGIDVVHRHTRRGADEPVGISGHQLRHLVVRNPRERQRFAGTADVLDRGIGRREDLDVAVAAAVHRAEARVEIEQRRHRALLILQPELWRRRLLARLVVVRRHDVIENVDGQHGFVGAGLSRLGGHSVSRRV